MAKLRSKWDYGIIVGVRPRSNEIWAATEERTWKVRSVRRQPEDARWSSDSVTWVRRTMCTRFQGDEQADEEIPEGKAVELPPQENEDRPGSPRSDTHYEAAGTERVLFH